MDEKMTICGSSCNRNRDKRFKFSFVEVVLLCLGIVLTCIVLVRCFFAIEFTDEAYTVSDALAIMHGNTAYSHASHNVAGMSFIPIIFYKVYELFVPSMEGIFLFSRIAFNLFRFVIIFITSSLLKCEKDRVSRMVFACLLIPYMATTINTNFSYTSTSAYLAILVSAMLYSSGYVGERKRNIRLFLAGIISAFMVMTHIVYALAVITFILLLFLYTEKNEKLKSILLYCLGGICATMSILIMVLFQSDFSHLVSGFNIILYGAPKGLSTATSLNERLSYAFGKALPIWIPMVKITIFCYIVFWTIDYLRFRKKSLFYPNYWFVSVTVAFVCLVIMHWDCYSDVGCACLGSFFLSFFLFKRRDSFVWYFSVYIIVFLVAIIYFTNPSGSRFYFGIPLIFPMILYLISVKEKWIHYLGYSLSFLLIVLMCFRNFDTYRDASVDKLDTRVKSGVYKGIYTTSDRAKDVVELENYINDNISDDESVSFRDNAPVAYLMKNKNICDIRTWDDMQWYYGCNDPTAMYMYYKNKGSIPDVISYIDFKRDDSLSIENPSDIFQYNDFVNEYYYLDKDDFKNTTFRVLIYRNNGSFDGDFDSLLDSIKL